MRSSNRETAHELSRIIGFEVFSDEYEILALLHEAGDIAYSDVSCQLRFPPATLGRKLELLCGKGLVVSRREHSDRRRRRFSLTGRARMIMDEELAFFSDWPSHQSDAAAAIAALVKSLQQRLGVRLFRQEYELVLGLYRNDGLRTLSLLPLARVSQGSFFNKLRVLKAARIIHSVRDDMDNRRVQISLSGWVARAIDDAHADLNRWASNLMRDR